MKLAILGGSFNPIHNGHILLAKGFGELVSANEILLIPTLIPPHKSSTPIVSAKDRINMCYLRSEERRVGKARRSRWSPYH